MHFPFLLDPQRSAVQAKPKLSAKTADEEVREQAAKAVGADERQRQALMRSFATVRTQFEDLDGQSNPRTIRVHKPSPGPSSFAHLHPFLQSHHPPEHHLLHALDSQSHGDYILDFDFADILRPPSPPPSPTFPDEETCERFGSAMETDDSDSDTIRPTSPTRRDTHSRMTYGPPLDETVTISEDGDRLLRPASRLSLRDDDIDNRPMVLTVRNGSVYTDGAELVRAWARSVVR